LVIYLPWI